MIRLRFKCVQKVTIENEENASKPELANVHLTFLPLDTCVFGLETKTSVWSCNMVGQAAELFQPGGDYSFTIFALGKEPLPLAADVLTH